MATAKDKIKNKPKVDAAKREEAEDKKAYRQENAKDYRDANNPKNSLSAKEAANQSKQEGTKALTKAGVIKSPAVKALSSKDQKAVEQLKFKHAMGEKLRAANQTQGMEGIKSRTTRHTGPGM